MKKDWDWMEPTFQEKKAWAEARMRYYDKYHPTNWDWKTDPSYDWAEKRKLDKAK